MSALPTRPAPRMIPLTWWIRRRHSNAAHLADMMALRKALLLCQSCEHKLSQRWVQRADYRLLPSFHGAGRCDGCRCEAPGNIYLPEEDTYMTGWQRIEQVKQAEWQRRQDDEQHAGASRRIVA